LFGCDMPHEAGIHCLFSKWHCNSTKKQSSLNQWYKHV